MNKTFILLMIVVLLALTACASPIDVDTSQPSSSDQVATIVGATMQAFSTNTPEAIMTETPAKLFRDALYYLGDGGHVFRLGRDGKTVTQITFETYPVTSYDVSPVDGSIAYVSSNQLILVNAEGSNRRVLVDGGPNGERITNLVF